MPKYQARDKKRRVNRAKANAEKRRKEVEQLRFEENRFGKAVFRFANDLPSDSDRRLLPPIN